MLKDRHPATNFSNHHLLVFFYDTLSLSYQHTMAQRSGRLPGLGLCTSERNRGLLPFDVI